MVGFRVNCVPFMLKITELQNNTHFNPRKLSL